MGGDQQPVSPVDRRLKVLFLYDRHSLFTNTVREHVESFGRFSRHHITYAHGLSDGPLQSPIEQFDAAIIHYSVRIAFDNISPEYAWALKTFNGLKALFIQDEYDNTWRACKWIEQLGIRLVFTCVPLEHVRKIYSKVDHDRVTFTQTLTGFVPIESDLEKLVTPLAERRTVIGYRGRPLPFKYGRLGQEKLMIGVRMRAECEARGIPCDIEWTEKRRIYGAAWPKFIASCRATLGTESGSNVFDFDGTLTASLNAALAANPKMTFADAEKQFLVGRELDGVMNQVSPRIFEAVALRTGLILFDGTYSDVVRPDEHFIPLRKDFSNVEEVLRRVRDDRELTAMTDRAYRDVIESGKYTYQTFIRGADDTLARLANPSRTPAVVADEPGVQSTVDLQVARALTVGPAWWRLAKRAVRKGWRGVAKYSGFRKLKTRVKQLLATKRLVMQDPVLRESYEFVREQANIRAGSSGFQLLREWHRLALLRHGCRDCPTILSPIWLSIRYDAQKGQIAFVAHPVTELPSGILNGQPVVDQAVAAIRDRSVKEIVWDRSEIRPEVALKVENVGNVPFFLGNDPIFHFTTLERLADLEPEKAARIVAHVAEGVRALANADTVVETSYRQAS